MGRLFDDASSQYLEASAAPVTALPLTIACWFRQDAAIAPAMVAIGVNGGTHRFQLQVSATGQVGAAAVGATTGATTQTPGGSSLNTWNHGAGTWVSNTSRFAFLNGGDKNEGTADTGTPTGLNIFNVGARWSTTRGGYMSGDIAEVGIWDVVLDDAEIAALGKGFSPLLIRPQSLVRYIPLLGNLSPEIELINGAGLTVTGATKSTSHPPMFKPGEQNSRRLTTGVGTVVIAGAVAEAPAEALPAVVSAEAVATAFPPTLSAVIYNSLDVPVVGLHHILSASIREAINQPGQATVVVPAGAPGVSDATVGVQIGIWRVGEGEIFRGRISGRERTKVTEGALVHLEISSLAEELRWENTFREISVANEDVQDTMDLLLAATSWTGLATGTYEDDVTKPWEAQTVYHSLGELAVIAKGYLRETHNLREVEIKNTAADSGIRLANLDAIGRSPEWGLIAALRSYKEQGDEIWNRIYPFGKTDGGHEIDLRESTRSSPYTIENELAGRPRVVDVTSTYGTLENGYGGEVDDREGYTVFNMGSVFCNGNNRAVIVFTRAGHFSSAFDEPYITEISVGGRPATYVDAVQLSRDDPAYTDHWACWVLTNPPKGEVAISGVKSINGGNRVIAISLRNVDQADPIFDQDNVYDTSSGTSISLPSITADMLLIAGLYSWDGSLVDTSPGSAFELYDTGIDGDYLVLAKREVSGTQTFSWTVGVSLPSCAIMIAVNPAISYYIESAVSQGLYGLRVKPLALGTVPGITDEDADETMVANTMYDAAADFLDKHKDPPSFYSFDVAYLPLGPLEWLVGDSIYVAYREDDLAVEDDLICVEREHSYDEDGVRRWALTLSTSAQMRADGFDKIAQFMDRVEAVQANQV